MLLRFEPWGAWARLESMPALVALDKDGVRSLGLDGGDAWLSPREVSMPLEVHVAVTSKCAAGCEGCYLDATADGEHVPFEELVARFDALAREGVFTVALGGGEPTSRDDIGEIGQAARDRGLVPVLTTSGLGLSRSKAERLRAFAQVNVSYDGDAQGYQAVRGFDGAAHAERAIKELAAAGVPVGVNVVLTQATFASLPATLRRARELGAREAQLLRYKPQGRAKSLDYLSRRLTLEQRHAFAPTLRALSHELSGSGFRIRIDCALVPFLSADDELYGDPERLRRFGVLGCEAGAALAASTVDGKLSPCSFAEASSANATEIRERWASEPTLRKYREFSNAPPEPCSSCRMRAVCKGGCKIVSQFAGGFGPDPECPRVERYREQPTI